MGLDFPTPRNWKALAAIDKYLREYDMAPTLLELADEIGIAAISGARRHVVQLEERGLIRFQRRGGHLKIAARSIRLTAWRTTRMCRPSN